MQKVIIINLNGNAYQLDEDAYAALRIYLDNAEAQLASNPDKTENGMIGAGIGAYVDLDPTIVRIIFVLLAILTHGGWILPRFPADAAGVRAWLGATGVAQREAAERSGREKPQRAAAERSGTENTDSYRNSLCSPCPRW
jgi:phage shock protein PspC (stress-responsive transcriptional regulator)